MITTACARDGSFASGGLRLAHLDGEIAVGKESDIVLDAVGTFERRWKLQLIHLGITTDADDSLDAGSEPQCVTEGAAPEKQRVGSANLSEWSGKKPEGNEIGRATSSCNVDGPRIPLVSFAFHTPASAAQSVYDKKSEKPASEVPKSSEAKSKESKQTKVGALNQDPGKRDEQTTAAAAPVPVPLSESVPSIATPRQQDSKLLQGRRDPPVRCPRVEQADKIDVVLQAGDSLQMGSKTAEVAPETLRFENKAEAKKSATMITDHFVTPTSKTDGIGIAASGRPESGIRRDNSGALTESDFATANSPSMLKSVSAPSISPRHSLSSKSDTRTHPQEGRAATTGTAAIAAETVNRGTLPGQTGDRTSPEFREHVSLSPSGIPERSSAAPDLSMNHPERQWVHVGPRLAEAGFHDDALGWVSVRAARDSSGIHAVLVPPSADAERALSGHLNGLNAYLGNNQIPVSAVTLSTFENGRQGSSFGADAQQQNGRDGCDERNGRPRRDALSVEPASTANGSKSQADAERYELQWARSGNSSKTHISLVA